MGADKSQIALESALSTHPNATLVSEAYAAGDKTLYDVVSVSSTNTTRSTVAFFCELSGGDQPVAASTINFFFSITGYNGYNCEPRIPRSSFWNSHHSRRVDFFTSTIPSIDFGTQIRLSAAGAITSDECSDIFGQDG